MSNSPIPITPGPVGTVCITVNMGTCEGTTVGVTPGVVTDPQDETESGDTSADGVPQQGAPGEPGPQGPPGPKGDAGAAGKDGTTLGARAARSVVGNPSSTSAEVADIPLATAAEVATGSIGPNAANRLVSLDLLPAVAFPAPIASAPNLTAGFVAAPYVRTHLERSRDGGLSIMNWIDPAIRSAIRAGTYTGALQAQVQNALNSGENLSIPEGKYPMDAGVLFKKFGQRMTGDGDRLNVVFQIRKPIIAAGSPAAMILTAHCAMRDISFDCDQPMGDASLTNGGLVLTGGNTSNTINQYPYLIDITTAARCNLDGIQMRKGWNGINGNGNCGGLQMGRIEDGTLNCGLLLNNPLDFVTVDSWESWVYNYGNTGLEKWSYANPGLLDIRSVDGLNWIALNMWKKRVLYNNPSELSGTFGIVKLDGGNASFQASGGRAIIGSLNGLTDVNTPVFINNGAIIDLGTVDIKGAIAAGTSLTTETLRHQSGTTIVNGGTIGGVTGYPDVSCIAGNLTIANVTFVEGTAEKTNGIINQTGGRVFVHDCLVRESGAPATGYFVYLNTNDHHKVHDNFFGGLRGRRPAVTTGPCNWHDNSGQSAEITF